MIAENDEIPSIAVKLVDAGGTSDVMSDELLGSGTVVFFAVPGAFTPTCHLNHLPGFLANAAKFRAAGASRIVCAAVNDHFVLKNWAEASNAIGVIDFMADARAEFARATGLERDTPALGTRFQRSAMLIRDGRVQAVFVEDAPGVSATGAPAVLMALEAAKG